MTERQCRGPDEGLNPVEKDTTRDSDQARKNTAKPDNTRIKGESKQTQGEQSDEVEVIDD